MDLKPRFQVGRRYIDNNLPGYEFHSGVLSKDFETQEGKNISTEIHMKVYPLFMVMRVDGSENNKDYRNCWDVFLGIIIFLVLRILLRTVFSLLSLKKSSPNLSTIRPSIHTV
jgi:hypothetical protein